LPETCSPAIISLATLPFYIFAQSLRNDFLSLNNHFLHNQFNYNSCSLVQYAEQPIRVISLKDWPTLVQHGQSVKKPPTGSSDFLTFFNTN